MHLVRGTHWHYIMYLYDVQKTMAFQRYTVAWKGASIYIYDLFGVHLVRGTLWHCLHDVYFPEGHLWRKWDGLSFLKGTVWSENLSTNAWLINVYSVCILQTLRSVMIYMVHTFCTMYLTTWLVWCTLFIRYLWPNVDVVHFSKDILWPEKTFPNIWYIWCLCTWYTIYTACTFKNDIYDLTETVWTFQKVHCGLNGVPNIRHIWCALSTRYTMVWPIWWALFYAVWYVLTWCTLSMMSFAFHSLHRDVVHFSNGTL